MPDQIDPLTPVDAERVHSLCLDHGLRDVAVHSVSETESTNADAAKLAKQGIRGWQIVVAATQTAGRGRLDRQWTDQGVDSLSFSLAVRVPPIIPVENWGWIPLLAGLAVTTVIRGHGVPATTKWPNDVIVQPAPTEPTTNATNEPASPGTEPPTTTALTAPGTNATLEPTTGPTTATPGAKKLVGILSEAVDGHAVVGVGINLTAKAEQLPLPTATSVAEAGGANLSREGVLAEILVEFDKLWRTWTDCYGDASAAGLDLAYAELSSTIGSQVSITGIPGSGTPAAAKATEATATEAKTTEATKAIEGKAIGVDRQGRLLLETPTGAPIQISVGDVNHLRH